MIEELARGASIGRAEDAGEALRAFCQQVAMLLMWDEEEEEEAAEAEFEEEG
jgi:hypothetical protein